MSACPSALLRPPQEGTAMRPSPALAIPLLAVLHATAWPALRVLFASGDRAADGFGVATIGSPQAREADDVVFAGRSGAVVLGRDGMFVVLAATGDPLPPPLSGTFNDFVPPALTASGDVVFAARVNSEIA